MTSHSWVDLTLVDISQSRATFVYGDSTQHTPKLHNPIVFTLVTMSILLAESTEENENRNELI
jgi:hypothetical protein